MSLRSDSTDLRDELLDRAPLAVLDVETTGLSAAGGDRVIEVGVVLADGWRETGSLEQLLDPQRPLDPRAMAVNGITEAMVAGQPRFADFLPELERALEGRILVAHNAPFDLGFLRREYQRCGRELPPRLVIDTVRVARRHFRFPRNGLAVLATHYGVSTAGAHRATADARMTHRVLAGMSRDLEAGGPLRVGDLLAGDSTLLAERPVSPRLDPAVLDLWQRLAGVGRRVEVTYRTGGGYETQRVLRPLSCEPPYLRAFCELRGEERTFRLDRILSHRELG